MVVTPHLDDWDMGMITQYQKLQCTAKRDTYTYFFEYKEFICPHGLETRCWVYIRFNTCLKVDLVPFFNTIYQRVPQAIRNFTL